MNTSLTHLDLRNNIGEKEKGNRRGIERNTSLTHLDLR